MTELESDETIMPADFRTSRVRFKKQVHFGANNLHLKIVDAGPSESADIVDSSQTLSHNTSTNKLSDFLTSQPTRLGTVQTQLLNKLSETQSGLIKNDSNRRRSLNPELLTPCRRFLTPSPSHAYKRISPWKRLANFGHRMAPKRWEQEKEESEIEESEESDNRFFSVENIAAHLNTMHNNVGPHSAGMIPWSSNFKEWPSSHDGRKPFSDYSRSVTSTPSIASNFRRSATLKDQDSSPLYSRSTSEIGQRYLLLRQTFDECGSNELLGSFEDNSSHAYRQLLSNLQCYHVMPVLGRLVSIDSKLPIRKAFLALWENQARGALVFNASTSRVERLVTYADLITLLLKLGSFDNKNATRFLNSPLDLYLMPCSNLMTQNDDQNKNDASTSSVEHSQLPLFSAIAEECLYRASRLLCQQRIHRLVVFDSYVQSNPLFLFSKKMVLKTMKKYIEFLPLPSVMFLSLEELKLGTWDNIVTARMDTNLKTVAEIFLARHLSTIPIVKYDDKTLIGVVAKSSIINAVAYHYSLMNNDPSNNDNQDQDNNVCKKQRCSTTTTSPTTANQSNEITINSPSRQQHFRLEDKTVADVEKHGVEPPVVVKPKTTLYAALNRLIHSKSHAVLLVDSKDRLLAIIAVVDFLNFLSGGFQ